MKKTIRQLEIDGAKQRHDSDVYRQDRNREIQ
jgi:hypothetical protein